MYPFSDTSHLSLPELRRQVLTRRVQKLIAWLHTPDYTAYTAHESIPQLVKLIDLIIWALERSLPENSWEPFRRQLLGTRYIAVDIFDNEDQERLNYLSCLQELEATLKGYQQYITAHDLGI